MRSTSLGAAREKLARRAVPALIAAAIALRKSRKAEIVMVAGCRVLLVEDEYLLARWMADEFAQLGVETVGPASGVEQALNLVEHGDRLDGAVLDISLRGDMVFRWPTPFGRAAFPSFSQPGTNSKRSRTDTAMW